MAVAQDQIYIFLTRNNFLDRFRFAAAMQCEVLKDVKGRGGIFLKMPGQVVLPKARPRSPGQPPPAPPHGRWQDSL